MKKHLILLASIFLFSFLNVSAQTAQPAAVKEISAGVVNGKAISLPRPAYPSAARAVNAEGAVNVKVMIDEEGNVISAEAVSGHPLLRQAAVQAAQQAKFKPTTLNEQAVKVTGIIVYNFVAAERPLNWFKIGYDLTSVQHAPSLIFLDTNSIDKIFQTDWTTEREQLKRLGEIKQAEVTNVSPAAASNERIVTDTTEKRSDGTTVRKVVKEVAVISNNPPDAEQVQISQSLIASLQSRLGGDELNLWRFNTGASLSQALSKARFTGDRQTVLDSLRNQIQSAPGEISPDTITGLQKILTILEKPTQSADDRSQIGQILPTLFRN